MYAHWSQPCSSTLQPPSLFPAPPAPVVPPLPRELVLVPRVPRRIQDVCKLLSRCKCFVSDSGVPSAAAFPAKPLKASSSSALSSSSESERWKNSSSPLSTAPSQRCFSIHCRLLIAIRIVAPVKHRLIVFIWHAGGGILHDRLCQHL